MSLSLTICPIQFDLAGSILLRTMIHIECQAFEFFERLQKVATPLSVPVQYANEDGLNEYTTDLYDDPITFVTASQFLLEWDKEQSNLNDWDQAMIAFVRSLKPDRRIILWWV